jgi:hypothetical protein
MPPTMPPMAWLWAVLGRRQVRVTQLKADLGGRQTQRVSSNLGHCRVGAGSDVGGRGPDQGRPVGQQAHQDGGRLAVGWPCPRPGSSRTASASGHPRARGSRAAPWGYDARWESCTSARPAPRPHAMPYRARRARSGTASAGCAPTLWVPSALSSKAPRAVRIRMAYGILTRRVSEAARYPR